VERSGSQKNRAERERGAVERERSGELRSEKSGLPQSGKTFCSAHMLCGQIHGKHELMGPRGASL